MTAALPPARIAKLSSYLNDLINDVAAQGKIAKIQGNPVEVAAVALMSGSIAVVEALMTDVRLLAGNAKTHAAAMGRPMLEGLVARGAGALLDRLLNTSRTK